MTGSVKTSRVIGHTRSGGFCSKASDADVVADARDIAGGDRGRRVPDGVEHKGEPRVAGMLISNKQAVKLNATPD